MGSIIYPIRVRELFHNGSCQYGLGALVRKMANSRDEENIMRKAYGSELLSST